MSPGQYILGRFASRATVTENIPARAIDVYLRCAASLVVAVIPFDEVRVDLRRRAQCSEITGVPRTLKRAGEHTSGHKLSQAFAQGSGVVLAGRCQRQVCQPCVLAG